MTSVSLAPHRSPVRSSGFTLIELLVVIAIIGILMGLLSPAIRAARARAGNTRCMSQLRSVGMVMTDYASSHNECSAPVIGDLDMYWDQGERVGWDITAGLWAKVPGGPGTIWRCDTVGAARVANYCAVGLDNRYRPIGGTAHYVPRSWWRDPVNLIVVYDAQPEIIEPPYPWMRAKEPMGGDCSDEFVWWKEPGQDPIYAYAPEYGPHGGAFGWLFGDGHSDVCVFPGGGPSHVWTGPRWWQRGSKQGT